MSYETNFQIGVKAVTSLPKDMIRRWPADDRADYSIVDCVAGRGDWRLAFESTRQLLV